jgi:hypothetical protein
MFFRSAEALLPPHECGGSLRVAETMFPRMNAGAPTIWEGTRQHRARAMIILHSALWNSRRGGVDVLAAGGQTAPSIAIPAKQNLCATGIFAREKLVRGKTIASKKRVGETKANTSRGLWLST